MRWISLVFKLCVTVSGEAVPVSAAANFFAIPVTAVLTYAWVAMTVVSTATESAATVMPVPAPTSKVLPVKVISGQGEAGTCDVARRCPELRPGERRRVHGDRRVRGHHPRGVRLRRARRDKYRGVQEVGF